MQTNPDHPFILNLKRNSLIGIVLAIRNLALKNKLLSVRRISKVQYCKKIVVELIKQ